MPAPTWPASARRARIEADPGNQAGGWRLNGRKIWTTNADHCHYMIALVRSSGEPGPAAGLSQFIVDLKLPGVTVRPIRDLAGDAHFSEVFFDDVLLADDALVGRKGRLGAGHAELAFERSGPERLYSSIVLLDHWIGALRKRPGMRERRAAATVGRFTTHLATLRQLSIAVTTQARGGPEPDRRGRAGQGHRHRRSSRRSRRYRGGRRRSRRRHRCRPAAGGGLPGQVAPTFSLRGGTREILRGMIARGLGLR
jgi:hypothetical protein